jgi:hypothetical protein
MTQVYCVASGFGVCARSADVIVAIKIRVRKDLSIAGGAEYLRRFFLRRRYSVNVPRAYLAQQWPPEQHLPPPQQSALREVAVAVPIMARVVIIIKRYFIESLLLN